MLPALFGIMFLPPAAAFLYFEGISNFLKEIVLYSYSGVSDFLTVDAISFH